MCGNDTAIDIIHPIGPEMSAAAATGSNQCLA
jgi:hypothetical protein